MQFTKNHNEQFFSSRFQILMLEFLIFQNQSAAGNVIQLIKEQNHNMVNLIHIVMGRRQFVREIALQTEFLSLPFE